MTAEILRLSRRLMKSERGRRRQEERARMDFFFSFGAQPDEASGEGVREAEGGECRLTSLFAQVEFAACH